jgi:putative addiction module component (TIGR02574 family)
MTLPEKLQLMEALWDSLARTPGQIESPEWHGDVLEECRKRAESGEGQFSDWETAKEEIRRRVS